MTATSPNFALLDANRPEVARLIAAMVQARDAVGRWSHPQEPTAKNGGCLRTLVLAQAATPKRIDDDVRCGKRETRRARR
jgi:hypothetical protein